MNGSFYQSKPWVKLMAVLRMERVNENGELLCEFCGKPIVHKYDCIGHHKIELTDQNITDAMIALNPDNVMLVHHHCHNKIHNKLGYYTRQVYLVYGCPLSGKTTLVQQSMSAGDLVVDMDNIWQCISMQERYVKPPRLNAVAFGVRDLLIDMIRTRRGKWQNAYLIGGYPLSSERERLQKSLNAREIFVDTSKEECLDRLRNLSDNRDKEMWEKFILDWWEKFLPTPHIEKRASEG